MSAHNPYAPPKAMVDAGPGVADIDSLPVFKNLSREERKSLSPFNVLAFLFGPFYYFWHGP